MARPPYPPRSWLAAHLLLSILLLTFAVAATASGQVPPNVALDTDDDGEPDLAHVSDWDGDGDLEIEDIRAALAALTDSDGRLLRVLAGSYDPPVDAPFPTPYLVGLDDNTTLECAPGAKLVGYGTSHPSTGGAAVVANVDPVNGNTNVTLTGCEIDGGLPDEYDSQALGLWSGGGMGVFFDGVSNLQILQNTIRDTFHACYYVRNSEDVLIDLNSGFDCGAFHDTAGSIGRPCMYFFASGGKTQQRVTVSNNHCQRFRVNAYNFRVAAPGDLHRDYIFSANSAHEAGFPTSACFQINGAVDVLVEEAECIETKGISISGGPSLGYASDHPPAHPSQTDIRQNITIRNSIIQGHYDAAGLVIGKFSEDVLIEDVSIEGTSVSGLGTDCVLIERPSRNTILRNLELKNCDGDGMTIKGAITETSEHVSFESIDIDGWDEDPFEDPARNGIVGIGRQFGLHFDGLTFTNVPHHPISFYSGLSESTFRNVFVDGLFPNYLGEWLTPAAWSCDASSEGSWLLLTDTETGCFDGGGGTTIRRCVCRDGVWSEFSEYPAGLRVFTPHQSRWEDVLLEHVHVQNMHEGYGVFFRDAAHRNVRILDLTASNTSQATQMRTAVDWPSDAANAFDLFGEDIECVGLSGICNHYAVNADDQFAPEQHFVRPTDGGIDCRDGQRNTNTSTGTEQFCLSETWGATAGVSTGGWLVRVSLAGLLFPVGFLALRRRDVGAQYTVFDQGAQRFGQDLGYDPVPAIGEVAIETETSNDSYAVASSRRRLLQGVSTAGWATSTKEKAASILRECD